MDIEIYPKHRKGRRTQWHWRTRDQDNGKILGRSSEGYANRAHCEAMVARHQAEMAAAVPVDVDG